MAQHRDLKQKVRSVCLEKRAYQDDGLSDERRLKLSMRHRRRRHFYLQ